MVSDKSFFIILAGCYEAIQSSFQFIFLFQPKQDVTLPFLAYASPCWKCYVRMCGFVIMDPLLIILADVY
jgi:hypothetical protein